MVRRRDAHAAGGAARPGPRRLPVGAPGRRGAPPSRAVCDLILRLATGTFGRVASDSGDDDLYVILASTRRSQGDDGAGMTTATRSVPETVDADVVVTSGMSQSLPLR